MKDIDRLYARQDDEGALRMLEKLSSDEYFSELAMQAENTVSHHVPSRDAKILVLAIGMEHLTDPLLLAASDALTRALSERQLSIEGKVVNVARWNTELKPWSLERPY